MASPTAASTAKVTLAATSEAATAQPESASSAPFFRYCRKAYTPAMAGPTGKELAMAVAARVMADMTPNPIRVLPASRRRICKTAKEAMEIASHTPASTTHCQCRFARYPSASWSSPRWPLSADSANHASAKPTT